MPNPAESLLAKPQRSRTRERRATRSQSSRSWARVVRGEDEIVPGARRHDRLGEGLEIATRDGAGMGHQRGRGGDLSGTGCALDGRVPGRGGPHGLADGIESQAEASGKAVDIDGGRVDAGHAETVPPPRLAREDVGLAEADADGRRRPVGLEPAARSGRHDHVSGAREQRRQGELHFGRPSVDREIEPADADHRAFERGLEAEEPQGRLDGAVSWQACEVGDDQRSTEGVGDGLGDLPLSHARRPVEVQGQPRLATADTFDRCGQAPSRLLGQRQALEIERGRVPGAEAAQPSIGGILAEEVAHDRLVEPYGPGEPRRALGPRRRRDG